MSSANAALFEWILTAYGRYPLAALSAFFDESTQPGSAFGVGGVLFRSKAALDRLNRQWEPLLKKHGISHFHTVDAVQGHGEFDGWTVGDRIQATDEYLAVLLANATGWFTCIVDDSLKADKVIKELPHGESLLGSTYALALLQCIQYISTSGRKAKPEDRVSCLYENGAPHKGTAHALLGIIEQHESLRAKFKLYNHAHGEKKDHPALQAADMVAYFSTKAYRLDPQNEEEEGRVFSALRKLPYRGLLVEDRNDLTLRYMSLRIAFGRAGALTRLEKRTLSGKQKQRKKQQQKTPQGREDQ